MPDGALSTLPSARKLDSFRERQGAEPLAPSAEPPSAADSPLALHWTLFAELFSSSHAATALQLGDLARRGLMTRACRDASLRLLTPDWQVPAVALERRRWLHVAGEDWREAIALRATLAGSAAEVDGWRSLAAAILAWPAEERAWILSPPALLSGEEIQALLAIGPGPAVGAALARLRRAQVEGVVRLREEAVALMRADGPGA